MPGDAGQSTGRIPSRTIKGVKSKDRQG